MELYTSLREWRLQNREERHDPCTCLKRQHVFCCYQKSDSDVTAEILNRIVLEKRPTDFRYIVTLKNEIIGNVSDGRLWLQKTSPHYWKCPQRYFRGTLSAKGPETTEIIGKFCFPKSTSIFNLCLSVCMFLISLKSNKSVADFCWWVIAFIWVTLPIGILRFKKEERCIVEFLESIGK